MVKKFSERKEAWMRIVVGIVSGIILALWRGLVSFLAFIHWIVVIFSGKRTRGLANFSEYFNTELYRFSKYMTFVTNERPFPFTDMQKMGKFGK